MKNAVRGENSRKKFWGQTESTAAPETARKNESRRKKPAHQETAQASGFKREG